MYNLNEEIDWLNEDLDDILEAIVTAKQQMTDDDIQNINPNDISENAMNKYFETMFTRANNATLRYNIKQYTQDILEKLKAAAQGVDMTDENKNAWDAKIKYYENRLKFINKTDPSLKTEESQPEAQTQIIQPKAKRKTERPSVKDISFSPFTRQQQQETIRQNERRNRLQKSRKKTMNKTENTNNE